MDTVIMGAVFGAVMGVAFAGSAIVAGLAMQWVSRGRKAACPGCGDPVAAGERVCATCRVLLARGE